MKTLSQAMIEVAERRRAKEEQEMREHQAWPAEIKRREELALRRFLEELQAITDFDVTDGLEWYAEYNGSGSSDSVWMVKVRCHPVAMQPTMAGVVYIEPLYEVFYNSDENAFEFQCRGNHLIEFADIMWAATGKQRTKNFAFFTEAVYYIMAEQ